MVTTAKHPATVLPALYYPYIHVRSEHWLKAALLTTPVIKRIVPEDYTPEDEPNIVRYTSLTGPNGPLLQAVPAYTQAAYNAQVGLLDKLREHAVQIAKTYDRSHAPTADEYWIHKAKFAGELLEYLKANRLAWPSSHSRAYGHRTWYALHPALGKAVMTTLGLSIAREQRYDMVTADGDFHEALLATKEADIFEALLGKRRDEVVKTRTQARQDLSQRVIVLTGVNFEALRPESIVELQSSKSFQSFQRILRAGASTIDICADSEVYRAQVEEEAEQIVSAWQDVRSSVTSTVREALFDSALTLGAEALKAAPHLPSNTTLYAAGGLLLYRIINKGLQIKKVHNSPYGYLTEISKTQNGSLRLILPLGLERYASV